MTKTAVYPGSFDPVTNGHVDIARRSLSIFDKIIIAVINNPEKKVLFSVTERKEMLRRTFEDTERVVVDSFEGLLVDFVNRSGADTIIRGLRAVSDFEYEFQMALMNRRLAPGIKSVYLMPSPEFSYISSSIIKEVYTFGGNVSGLIPPVVEEYLREKIRD